MCLHVSPPRGQTSAWSELLIILHMSTQMTAQWYTTALFPTSRGRSRATMHTILTKWWPSATSVGYMLNRWTVSDYLGSNEDARDDGNIPSPNQPITPLIRSLGGMALCNRQTGGSQERLNEWTKASRYGPKKRPYHSISNYLQGCEEHVIRGIMGYERDSRRHRCPLHSELICSLRDFRWKPGRLLKDARAHLMDVNSCWIWWCCVKNTTETHLQRRAHTRMQRDLISPLFFVMFAIFSNIWTRKASCRI